MIQDLVRLTCRGPVSIEKLKKKLGIDDRFLADLIAVGISKGYQFQHKDGMLVARTRVGSVSGELILGKRKPGRYRVGIMTDTHFGSRWCDVAAVRSFLLSARKAGCQIIVCTGDLVDGNASVLLPDQISSSLEYQMAAATKVLSEFKDMNFTYIAGNHCGKFSSSMGMEVGLIIQSHMRKEGIKIHYRGAGRGSATIHGARWEFAHPHGGASTRNAVRRVLNGWSEALDVPCDIVAMGHFHKYATVNVYPENIYGVAGGCFQTKGSEFSNRIANAWDVGGTIVSYQVNRNGSITEKSSEFFPSK